MLFRSIQNDNIFDYTDEDLQAISGIIVVADQYYYNGSEWILSKTALASVTTSGAGVYKFEDLPTAVDVNGKCYAAGYKLYLRNAHGPYLATKHHVGDDPTVDSDLMIGSMNLTTSDEYIVAAAEPTAGTDGEYNSALRMPSPTNILAMRRATVVLPVPGLPVRSMWGRRLGISTPIAFRMAMTRR